MPSPTEKRPDAKDARIQPTGLPDIHGDQAGGANAARGDSADSALPATARNVLTAARERMALVFDEFDNVCVSFSGGKDSGVLLNLALDEAKWRGRSIGVFHMDYEAQYQMTTDYVNEVYAANQEHIQSFRFCLPLAAQCCTSMHQDHWIPWDREHQDLWVREMPENGIQEERAPDYFRRGMWDYEFQEKFGPWFHEKNRADKTALLVGIRTQESFNRWRAIHSDRNYRKYKELEWTKEMVPNVFNAYPIFDWKTEDIWTANARFGWSYNKLYDLFHQAGMTIDKMRVASPFNDCAAESLKYYKAIDPRNWGKMIGRVNGVNFTGIYGGTTAMGWRSIKLPRGHTWKSYMEFLLSTLPESAAENYKKKLAKSITFWKEKGGCLSPEVIAKLKAEGVPHEVVAETNYDTPKKPVRMDYLDDIDIEEFREIPTYKRMCVCIMKNDHLCKFMGFSLTKTETQIRSEALHKYESIP